MSGRVRKKALAVCAKALFRIDVTDLFKEREVRPSAAVSFNQIVAIACLKEDRLCSRMRYGDLPFAGYRLPLPQGKRRDRRR